jgi:HPt (histidine-containing phosphotransfer) domain-containing protein
MSLYQDESKYYNLAYLKELSAGDTLFVRSIVKQFVAEAPLVIQKIVNASREHNWDDLTYQVHKFIPNLAFVGISDIKDEMYNLELFSKNRTDLSTIPQLVNILEKRCELALNSLKKDFEL